MLKNIINCGCLKWGKSECVKKEQKGQYNQEVLVTIGKLFSLAGLTSCSALLQ